MHHDRDEFHDEPTVHIVSEYESWLKISIKNPSVSGVAPAALIPTRRDSKTVDFPSSDTMQGFRNFIQY